MDGYLKVLLFAAMPAIGNFLGGLLAEFFNVSQKSLSLSLHLAGSSVFKAEDPIAAIAALKAYRPL